jgi:type IV pilus assembly protein PilA
MQLNLLTPRERVIFSGDPLMINSLRSRKKGFTLIELLVVVLILAILMAVALPLYLSAVADSEKKTCRANLQTIANAVQAYRVKNRASTAIPSMTDLNGDLGATPKCPNNGTYSVASDSTAGSQGFKTSCSISAHGDFIPGISSS